MSNHYNTLGVGKDASPDQIKKAYRKLASQHHPDKGGDTAKFQELQTAYDTLSDPQAKAEYDNPQQQYRFDTNNMNGFEDIFNQFGFGPMGMNRRNQQVRRNKSITIQVRMTLKEVFEGKDVLGSIQLPSGREQALQIKIPRGVKNGDQIKYQGLGDDSIPNAPRGDLVAHIAEIPDRRFARDGANLFIETNITVFDAIVGTTVIVDTIADSKLEISVPVGIQGGQMINCKGHGLPEAQGTVRGNMYVKINVKTPVNIAEEDKVIIEQLRGKYAI